jgi:hypothetical protein
VLFDEARTPTVRRTRAPLDALREASA